MENKVKEVLGKHILADGYDLVMDFQKSHESYIVDRLSGNEILDMFSMFGSASIGYNHPYVKSKAAWLGELAIYKPAMSDMYYQEYADFMEVFSRVAIPDYLSYCFFVEGGALAVENALKTAFDWKTRKNIQKGSSIEGSQAIHFKQAFHGRSGYTLCLTNTADPRKYQYFPIFKWPRITNPKLYFPITEENLAITKKAEDEAIAQIKTAIANAPEEVSCIIIEPIQAEGGDNFFRDEFLVELRNLCNAHDMLLIFDEVQTGMGLTGKMWAHQHYSVKPDVMSFGKKAQVCGILANKERLNEVENHVFVESSRINSTFGGNFIDMLRFQLVLEVIEKENLVENAKVVGEHLLAGLETIAAKYDFISNARGKGLMCAFDLPNDADRNTFIGKLFAKNLMCLSCGTESVRFRPHLNVTKADIDKALQIIETVCSEWK